jgi:hypothetical protein
MHRKSNIYENIPVVLLDLKYSIFERNLNLSRGPQSSLVPPCMISLGGPDPHLLDKWISNRNIDIDIE